MALPPMPFDACDKQGTRVSSLSLVRYRSNDYSVPVAYGHQEVWIRGYVHEVVIGCGVEIIARHPRSYDREDLIFDPIHYLPLLEKKIGALDQAAPLIGWDLPEVFATLRRLLEARMGKSGKREYVQILRLLETFELDALHGAVKDALRLGANGYDAVKHLVLCRIEQRPPRLDPDVYPYLPRARVTTTVAAGYMRAPRKIPAVFPDRIESGISDVWIGGTSHGPEGFFRHRAAVCRAGRQERPAGEDRRGCSVGRLPAASRGGMAQADRGTEVAGRA